MNAVKKHAIPALITAATVLAVIYALRKLPVVSPITAPFVNRALVG